MGLFSWFGNRPERDSDLEERMERLERALKSLDEEWTTTYDNFRRLSAKVAKRAAALEKADDAPELPFPATNGHSTRPLTPAEKTQLLRGVRG